jgi:RNA polymerase sigma-70 factor (ECF subfamily)
LYERYRGLVSAVVRGEGSGFGESDAEDLCHEVFLSLLSLAPKYRPGNSLRGWLCGIALKKRRRIRDRGWRQSGLLARFLRPSPPPPTGDLVADQRIDVQRLLDRLSPPLREVVVLSLIEQMTAEDVGAALGIRVNTVWTRLHRARERIRALMEEDAS